MKRTLVILTAAAGIGMAASTASAHHSHPNFYDQCRSVTIEGRVDSVQWKDPHTWVLVRVDEGMVYTVDWNPMTRLTRNQIIDSAKAALVSGARVAVTGNPIRTAAQIRERSPEFTSDVNPRTVDPISIRRADNSFTWTRGPGGISPDCGRK